MRKTLSRICVVAIAATANAFVLAPVGVAHADPGLDGCTSSYSPYTEPDLAAIDPGITPDLFAAIDKNGDTVICFKPYPNGTHHGHGGNLTDNNSATHD